MQCPSLSQVVFDSESIRQSVCNLCVTIHMSVQQSSDEFYAELQRRNYTTPTSYLELISSYIQMLDEQGGSVNLQVSDGSRHGVWAV